MQNALVDAQGPLPRKATTDAESIARGLLAANILSEFENHTPSLRTTKELRKVFAQHGYPEYYAALQAEYNKLLIESDASKSLQSAATASRVIALYHAAYQGHADQFAEKGRRLSHVAFHRALRNQIAAAFSNEALDCRSSLACFSIAHKYLKGFSPWNEKPQTIPWQSLRVDVEYENEMEQKDVRHSVRR